LRDSRSRSLELRPILINEFDLAPRRIDLC
jgi:hypothetical protein